MGEVTRVNYGATDCMVYLSFENLHEFAYFCLDEHFGEVDPPLRHLNRGGMSLGLGSKAQLIKP